MRKITRWVQPGHEPVHPNKCSVCKEAGFNRAQRRRAHDMNKKGIFSAREAPTDTYKMLAKHLREES